jgi:hypothetical protein
MTPRRPEYIRCIRHTHAELLKQSWCGIPLSNFDRPFVDIDHAAYAVRNEGRLVPCPDCINVIASLFSP